VVAGLSCSREQLLERMSYAGSDAGSDGPWGSSRPSEGQASAFASAGPGAIAESDNLETDTNQTATNPSPGATTAATNVRRPCHYFLNGGCWSGNLCRFHHANPLPLADPVHHTDPTPMAEAVVEAVQRLGGRTTGGVLFSVLYTKPQYQHLNVKALVESYRGCQAFMKSQLLRCIFMILNRYADDS